MLSLSVSEDFGYSNFIDVLAYGIRDQKRRTFIKE